MKRSRVGRREFVRGIAGSAAAIAALPSPGFATPLARQTTPKIKFAVIGLNHGHINGQIEAVIRGGGELVSMFAKEPDLTAAFVKRFPQVEGRSQRGRDSRGQVDSAGGQRFHPRRAGAARRSRDEARQGLHGRQAGHHDARAAGRGASRSRPRRGASTRSCTASGSRTARRSEPGSWSRPAPSVRSCRRSDSGPHRMSIKTRPAWFFERPRYRRHPLRHRVAPGGPVPVLHRLDAGPGRCRRRSATCTIRSIPGFEDFGDMTVRGDRGPATSAWTGSRPMAWRPGATGG